MVNHGPTCGKLWLLAVPEPPVQQKAFAPATLLIRNLDDDLERSLNERAHAFGRSPEEEVRRILEEALRPRGSGRELWERLSRGERADTDFGGGLDQSTGRAFFG